VKWDKTLTWITKSDPGGTTCFPHITG
jgi:hypothetical protein